MLCSSRHHRGKASWKGVCGRLSGKKKINNNLHTRLCFNCRRRLFTIYNLFAGLCYGPVFPVPLLSVLIFLQLAEVYCSVSYSDGMNIHILLRWPFSFSISFFPTTLLSFSLLLPPLLLYCCFFIIIITI